MSVQEHDSWTGLLGSVQCLIANLGIFASILFFLRKIKENCTNLPGFVEKLFFIFYIFWCLFVLNNLLHL